MELVAVCPRGRPRGRGWANLDGVARGDVARAWWTADGGDGRLRRDALPTRADYAEPPPFAYPPDGSVERGGIEREAEWTFGPRGNTRRDDQRDWTCSPQRRSRDGVGPIVGDGACFVNAWFPEFRRVGEAANPGPRGSGSVRYADPSKVSFRGARCTEGPMVRSGCPGDDPPEAEPWALRLITANTTGWGPLMRLAMSTDADVILAQEHKLRGAEVATASDWALRKGWKTIWEEAALTTEGGRSGGVVIMVKSHLGLSPPPWKDATVVKARAVAATLEAPSMRPTVLVSAYLFDGVGPSAANRGILAAIGGKLQSLGHGSDSDQARHEGPMPYVIGADFNFTPTEMADTGFVDNVNGTVVAPKTAGGTCRTATAGRTLDYFIVSSGLDQGIERIEAGDNRVIKTHVPVKLCFRPRLTMLRALALRVPPKLPTDRVFGPVRPPPDWGKAKEATARALQEAREGQPEAAQRRLDEAYAHWATTAEEELQEVTGCQLPKVGCRAQGPRLVWRTILPEKVHRGRRSKAADDHRGRVALLRSMGIAVQAAQNGSLHHAKAMAMEIWRMHREQGDDGRAGGAGDVGRVGEGGEAADEVERVRRQVNELMDLLMGGLQTQHCEGWMDWATWERKAEQVTTEVQRQLRRAEHEERSEAAEAWKEWVAEGAAGGAKNAHRAVKLPQLWVPTTTTHEVTGALTADPMQLLAAQRREYAGQWAARTDGQRRWYAHKRVSLPRLSQDEIRSASRSVKHDTAQTYDGFHPRHMALICDEGLGILAELYEAAELIGSWPNQISLITLPALPKPDGGYRLIGIFAAVYRVWARARRPLADEWEARHDRPYFAAGSHRSPVDAVWRQSLRAEAAVAKEGWTAAAVLTDLEKFYEHIDHEELLARATRLDFPEPLARLALAAYGGPRMIRMKNFVAEELYADRGVVAGCSLATTLTKVYTVEAYDHLVRTCPRARFDNFIDDNVVSAEGNKEEVVEILAEATALLSEVVSERLMCRISRRKTRVVAAHEDVGRRLKRLTEGAVGGALAPSAPNLGTDFAAGKARRRHGRGRRAAARLRQGLRRKQRLRRVAGIIGGTQGMKVFVTGTLSAMTFGSEVHGLTDAEVMKVDRLAAATVRPKARGRSLHTLMALLNAPTWRASTAPVLQYVRAVWRATAAATNSGSPDLTLPELRAAWEALDKEALRDGARRRRRWDRVKGPLGACYLSIDRLGWRMEGPFTLVDDKGIEHQILSHSPAMWADLVRGAVVRNHERRAAEVLARRDKSFEGRRICLDHIRPMLTPPSNRKRKARLDPLGYGIARALACNAIWTNGRANELDASCSPDCALCGKARDTLHHRLWWCEATEELRKRMISQRLCQRARREGAESQFFVTGIMPHPADVLPSPVEAPRITVKRYDGGPTDGELNFQGHFYVDGSCSTHAIPELRRAGWAVVVTTPEGRPIASISSPLWRDLPQSPQAAEFVAHAAAVQYMAGPSIVFGDCENVVRQATARPKVRVAPGKKYSGVMRDVLKYPQRLAHQEQFRKVKAHVNIDALENEEDKRHARGNAWADELAKEAARSQPAPTPAEQGILDVDIADARSIVKYAAEALRKWPPLDRKASGEKRQAGRRKEPRKEEEAHDWQFLDGAWRCTRCLRCAIGATGNPGGSRGKCTAIGTDEKAKEAQMQGHSVAIVESDGLPVIFCARCGAWTARRKRGTAKPCRGWPTGAGKQALFNINRGKHPWLPPGKRDYQRANLSHVSHAPRDASAKRRCTAAAASSGGGEQLNGRKGTTAAMTIAQFSDTAAATEEEYDAVEGFQHELVADGYISEEDVFGHGASLDQPAEGGQLPASEAREMEREADALDTASGNETEDDLTAGAKRRRVGGDQRALVTIIPVPGARPRDAEEHDDADDVDDDALRIKPGRDACMEGGPERGDSGCCLRPRDDEAAAARPRADHLDSQARRDQHLHARDVRAEGERVISKRRRKGQEGTAHKVSKEGQLQKALHGPTDHDGEPRSSHDDEEANRPHRRLRQRHELHGHGRLGHDQHEDQWLHRLEGPRVEGGCDSGAAHKRPRLEADGKEAQPPGRARRDHGGIPEGVDDDQRNGGRVNLHVGSEFPVSSCNSRDANVDIGPLGSVGDFADALRRRAPGRGERRRRQRDGAGGEEGLRAEHGQQRPTHLRLGGDATDDSERAASERREEKATVTEDGTAGDATARRRGSADAASSSVDRAKTAKLRIADMKKRLSEGREAPPRLFPPQPERPREGASIRGRTDAPGTEAVMIRPHNHDTHGIRGQDGLPGREMPTSRAQLLRRLRGEVRRDATSVDQECRAEHSIGPHGTAAAALPATATSPPPACVRRGPPRAAEEAPPRDRAELLRRLSSR